VTSTDTLVTLSVADDIAHITLNRPDRGNALDLDLARALADTIARVDGASLSAVVLSGAGPNFCVGGDLRAFADAEDRPALIEQIAGAAHDTVRGLRALPGPVISVVRGACAGAGIGLAAAADLVLAARGAKFKVAYTAAGLAPDAGTSWVLTRTLGPARAADLILTNPVFTAEQAFGWGLVSRVIDDAELDAEAAALAGQVRAGSRAAQAEAVRLIRDARLTPLDEHLDAEAAAITRASGTPEGREGVDGFLAKRAPDFRSVR